jgi:glycosyltransferase involved in cell wall biosynthesis
VTGPRALVVAYDFPPHGAIGTMRTLRLVRQLRADGWQVTVLTGDPETYLPGTPVDPTLLQQIPPGVRVLSVRARRPVAAVYRALERSRPERPRARERDRSVSPAARRRPAEQSRLRKTIGWLKDGIDATLEIPDKECAWIAPAVARGLRDMLAHGRPDVIYSTAPPWSGQVVGLALALVCRRPWMADFRDPWARAPWREWRVALRRWAAARLERLVMARADRVVFVTQANRAEYAAYYGSAAAGRMELIPNGCDPSDFEGIPLPQQREHSVLLHAGALYGGRTPVPVLRAVAAACRRGTLAASRFRLRFLGHISPGLDVEGECRRLGIEDVVEIVPRVTRVESLGAMRSASALLLIQTGTTVSVPGKAYEYLAAGRPILALTEDGETADLVRASGIGVVARPQDPPEVLEAALTRVIALASSGLVPAPAALFDGRAHARTAVDGLRQLAMCQHGRSADGSAVAKSGRLYREDSAR